MRICVIGAGRVGGVLGAAWAESGHSVVFGVRDPEAPKVHDVVRRARGASAMSITDGAATSEVVVLATPYDAAGAVVAQVGNWGNRILVDCTNPVAPGLKLAVGFDTSAAEEIAREARGARVVKAFNTTGYENMADPAYGGHRAAMFVCGDDTAACTAVADLAREIGFEPVVTGPLQHARYLEPMALLWIDMAVRQGKGRNAAFGWLTR